MVTQLRALLRQLLKLLMLRDNKVSMMLRLQMIKPLMLRIELVLLKTLLVMKMRA
jgi:hypothetical protein